MNLRLRADEKARLVQAARLNNTDLTSFVLQLALREADAVIERAQRRVASQRDFQKVLDLLDDPPQPNARLRAAAAALPRSA